MNTEEYKMIVNYHGGKVEEYNLDDYLKISPAMRLFVTYRLIVTKVTFS